MFLGLSINEDKSFSRIRIRLRIFFLFTVPAVVKRKRYRNKKKMEGKLKVTEPYIGFFSYFIAAIFLIFALVGSIVFCLPIFFSFFLWAVFALQLVFLFFSALF